MTAKTAAFERQDDQEPFVMVPISLWEDDSLSLWARTVWVSIAAFAWQKEEAWPGQTRLAEMMGMSERTLRDALRELEAAGLLVTHRRGLGQTNLYRLRKVRHDAPDGPAPHAAPDRREVPVPSEVDEVEAETTSSSSAREGELFDGEPTIVMGSEATNVPLAQSPLLSDALALRRQGTKVDGRKVTAEEMGKAVDALDEFNAQAGKLLSLGPHLTPIVGRVREVPAMTGGEHRKLVQSAFRLKWWEKGKAGSKRPLTPSVIYGSSKCFANIMSDQEEESKGTTRRGRFTRRSPVEGDDEHY